MPNARPPLCEDLGQGAANGNTLDRRGRSCGRFEKGACEVKGFENLLRDFGKSSGMILLMDARAAIGMLEKRGLGSTKHIDTKSMWLQGSMRRTDITLHNIDTRFTPADLMTKLLISEDLSKHCKYLGDHFVDGEGRAEWW